MRLGTTRESLQEMKKVRGFCPSSASFVKCSIYSRSHFSLNFR